MFLIETLENIERENKFPRISLHCQHFNAQITLFAYMHML